MESFSRGWSFLQQAWQMAFKDKDLIKPSIYALIVGSIVSVTGAIPIIGVAFFLSDAGRIGQFILAIMGAFLVFLNFVVSYVFSGMTVYLIYEYLTEGDGRMRTAWSIVRQLAEECSPEQEPAWRHCCKSHQRRGRLAGSFVDRSGVPDPAGDGDRRYESVECRETCCANCQRESAAGWDQHSRRAHGDGIDRLSSGRSRCGVGFWSRVCYDCDAWHHHTGSSGDRSGLLAFPAVHDGCQRDQYLYVHCVSHLLVSVGAQCRGGPASRSADSSGRACSVGRSVGIISNRKALRKSAIQSRDRNSCRAEEQESTCNLNDPKNPAGK
jgi:hypothetical protein